MKILKTDQFVSKYILENKDNGLVDFRNELEKIVISRFNSIDMFEKGRMVSMLNKTDYFAKRDNEIKDLCSKYKVFIAKEDEDDVIDNTMIRVTFESEYGENMTDEIYSRKNIIMFHLADSENLESIANNGLEPRLAVKKFKMKNYHPERIYVLDGTISQSKFKQYASQLSSDAVVIIDLAKLKNEYNETIDLFKDPQSAERISLYTDMPIRKEVLMCMMLKDFYKTEIFKSLIK